MSSDRDSVTPDVASEHLLGRVKWFNNKAGYGFVTVTDGSRSGTDVFVHHSAVNVDSQQYKYLVQGEYVEFDLIKVESDKHEWQAASVSGIRGGKLMCETRHELKVARTEYKTAKPASEETRMPRQKTATEHRQGTREPRQRPQKPVARDGDKKEWTLVAGRGRPRKTPASSTQSS